MWRVIAPTALTARIARTVLKRENPEPTAIGAGAKLRLKGKSKAMNILPDLAEALKMALSLPFYASLPIYLIGYGAALWVLAKAIKALKDVLR